MKAAENPALQRYTWLGIALRRISLADDNLQELYGSGMVLGFTVLGHVFFVRVGGSEGGGSAQNLVRDLGFMVDELEGRWNIVKRGDPRL